MSSIPLQFGRGASASLGGYRRTKLWTNSDPTAVFPAQTISLDLTPYTSVLIFYNYNATTPKVYSREVLMSVGGTILNFVGITAGGQGGRTVTVTDTGIDFDNAHAASSTNANQYCIPVEIYGVTF